MGLARKANVDGVAAGGDATVDISSILRQAVAAEIERQRLDNLRLEAERDPEPPVDDS